MDVDNLIKLEPYVKFSRKETIRNLSSIISGDVHHSHEEEVAYLVHSSGLDVKEF